MNEISLSPAGEQMRLIGLPELQRLVPISRATIWRKERDGSFPKSVRLSANRRAWREADVLAWLSAKLEGK